MTKKHDKIYKTKVLILQGLYSWYLNRSCLIKIDHFLFERTNLNNVCYHTFMYFIKNIIKKDLILTVILNKHSCKIINSNLVELIILKMVIFEIFFCNKRQLNIIVSEALYLANKFSSKRSYKLIKNAGNNIILDYVFFKLLFK
ncbi:MAG TPA: transcription antitermination factor NusB [Candidatus Azoamicus sp. OHIO2]